MDYSVKQIYVIRYKFSGGRSVYMHKDHKNESEWGSLENALVFHSTSADGFIPRGAEVVRLIDVAMI